MSHTTEKNFVKCLNNEGYEASLDQGREYRFIPDEEAARHNQLRIVDESGEDYLYPGSYFSQGTAKRKGPTLWKVRCMDNYFPGMWQRWYKNQCVALGWPPAGGYTLLGESIDKSWSYTRNRLLEIQDGDFVAVLLSGNRIGRIGQVVGLAIDDDDWSPFVEPGYGLEHGELGRRILLRWDLTVGPDRHDYVVNLPTGFWSSPPRRAISRELSVSIDQLKGEMADPSNWSSLLLRFPYERALSDYIACFPARLEDGLLPHPNTSFREHVFTDRSRADILLVDADGVPVVVECKQSSPSIEDVAQVRHYMEKATEEIGRRSRGILVHGGATKIREDVVKAAHGDPAVEIVNYVLDVTFKPSASQTLRVTHRQ